MARPVWPNSGIWLFVLIFEKATVFVVLYRGIQYDILGFMVYMQSRFQRPLKIWIEALV